MKYLKIISISLIALFILSNCKQEKADLYYPHNKNISYNGRVDHQLEEVILIGSASSATMYFTGDTCLVYLQNNNPNGTHNYFSIELDNEDIGRFKIESDTTVVFPIEITFEKEVHKIVVTKSTEAANGYINFKGIFCYELVEPLVLPKKTIEFIGNSITCGMSNDTIDIPCGKGIWYDQHNAYWAYGPTVSRALKVNSYLSSVSGIGMYRNWNGIGPTMPEVYDNLYLNLDNSKKHDYSGYNPDIISICLGTNDFSDGDGINERLPFDAEVFTSKYINFVQNLLSHFPETQIALLSSPMVNGDRHQVFLSCLENVKEHFVDQGYKPFKIFEFEDIVPHGCGYHPDINDHMQMADQLYPFYRNLLEE